MNRRSVLAFILMFSVTSCVKKAPPPAEPPKDPYIVDVPPVEETLRVHTTPSGATVTLSTGESCQSPCAFKKMSNDTFDVTVTKKGYAPSTVTVVSHARAIAGSGASGKPEVEQPHLWPNPVSVTLRKGR